jgi:uncharacterized Tic20 family protein
MPLTALIDRARQGDANAIARLITRSLAEQGVVARAHWQGNELSILLEGDEALNQAETVPIIRRGLMRLGLTCPVDQVSLVSRQVGQPAPDWQEQFWLNAPGEAPQTPPAAEEIPVITAAPAPDDSAPFPSDHATEVLLSDHALVALSQLGPLFGYLMVVTNGVIGFPFVWWGSTFLLPWRIVPPLVLLLVRGQDSPFVRQQSKYALNFQLSMVIYWIVTITLMFVLIGFLFVIPLALLELICIIIAAVKASEGKVFRYPLAIPFVR